MRIVIKGKLLERTLNIGSKSEHKGFVLEVDGQEIVIVKRGDNPFQHETLRPLVNKMFRAIGAHQGTKFIATSLEVI